MTERRGSADLRESDLVGLALSACRAHDGQQSDEDSLGRWAQDATALLLFSAWDRAPSNWHETVRANLEQLPGPWVEALDRALKCGSTLACERIFEHEAADEEDEEMEDWTPAPDLEAMFTAPATSEPTPRDEHRIAPMAPNLTGKRPHLDLPTTVRIA